MCSSLRVMAARPRRCLRRGLPASAAPLPSPRTRTTVLALLPSFCPRPTPAHTTRGRGAARRSNHLTGASVSPPSRIPAFPRSPPAYRYSTTMRTGGDYTRSHFRRTAKRAAQQSQLFWDCVSVVLIILASMRGAEVVWFQGVANRPPGQRSTRPLLPRAVRQPERALERAQRGIRQGIVDDFELSREAHALRANSFENASDKVSERKKCPKPRRNAAPGCRRWCHVSV